MYLNICQKISTHLHKENSRFDYDKLPLFFQTVAFYILSTLLCHCSYSITSQCRRPFCLNGVPVKSTANSLAIDKGQKYVFVYSIARQVYCLCSIKEWLLWPHCECLEISLLLRLVLRSSPFVTHFISGLLLPHFYMERVTFLGSLLVVIRVANYFWSWNNKITVSKYHYN